MILSQELFEQCGADTFRASDVLWSKLNEVHLSYNNLKSLDNSLVGDCFLKPYIDLVSNFNGAVIVGMFKGVSGLTPLNELFISDCNRI